MIYIITHTDKLKYIPPVKFEVVRTDLTGLPDRWKDIRGIRALISNKHLIPDEDIANFQYRRYLDWFDPIPDGYDCIGGKPFFTAFKPFDQYASSHHLRDIAIVEEIVHDQSFSTWLHSYQLPCYDNMFIMRRSLWIEYMEWLLEVLDKWDAHPDRSKDETGYQSQAPSFLAERLGGWWTSRLKLLKVNRIQLPR